MQRKTQIRLAQESKFKPKRVILDGVPYDVDSLDKLDKIKEELRAKKRHEEDIKEEQKNQKILITKTRIGNSDQKITKVITDIGMMPDRNKRRIVVAPPPKKDKPTFVLKTSNPIGRIINPNNIENSPIYPDATLEDTISEPQIQTIYRTQQECNLTSCSNTSSNLTVKSHARREIPKLKTREDIISMNMAMAMATDDNKSILINQSNAYQADYTNGYESKAPKFQIKTHDRKPIAKDGLLSQEDSYRLRFGNNDVVEQTQAQKEKEIELTETTEQMEEKAINDQPKKVTVISHANRIKQLARKENNSIVNEESIESEEKTKQNHKPSINKIKELTNKLKESELEKIEDTFVNLALPIKTEKKSPKNLKNSSPKNLKKSPKNPENLSPKNIENSNLTKINEIKEINEDEPKAVTGFFNEQYKVTKSEWYVLAVKSRGNNEGLIKILDETKSQMMPSLKINNDMFVYRKYDGKVNEYRIYVKTLRNSTQADVYIVGLDVMSAKMQQVSFNIVQKNVDLWKFRKFYDLEFINYYISSLKFDCSEKFIERFNADYKLYKNPDLFDTFISNLKIDTSVLPKDTDLHNNNKENILYLVNTTIEYEESGTNIRYENLLKNLDDKYKAIVVSRYGYPYDQEEGYFSNKPEEITNHNDILHYKLLNSTDNYNSNNIIDYIKKYIVSTIKLAVKTNAKIIIGTGNFINGLTSFYAAKFLGIKSVYEIMGFYDESIVAIKPDLKGSNLLKMYLDQEQKVIDNADLIITNSQQIANKINIENHKIKIINDYVDTDKFKPDNDKRIELRSKYNISDTDTVISYFGSITSYQGVEYILESLKLLLLENPNIKFLLIGDGPHLEYIENYINELELGDHVINLGKISHDIIHEYYNMTDIVISSKKNYDYCKNTISYKIFEGMAMAKPVITNIILDNTISFQYENVNELYEKIKDLISNHNDIGIKARDFILENNKNSKITLI